MHAVRRGTCTWNDGLVSTGTQKHPSDNVLVVQEGNWIEANIVVTGLSKSDNNSIFISFHNTCIRSPTPLADYLWVRSHDICPRWAGAEEGERCKWLKVLINGDADNLNNTKIGWCNSTEGGTDIKPQYLITVTTSTNCTSTSGRMKAERGELLLLLHIDMYNV